MTQIEPIATTLPARPRATGVASGVCPPPMPRIKSPLRYPGGKSRAVDTILALMPTEIGELCSPFMGGGSVELAAAARGLRVYGADAFKPVVDFWRCAIRSPELLAERARKYLPLSKAQFYKLQESYLQHRDPVERAALFFVLNRSSFSGTTLSGGMSPGHPRFTESAIQRLEGFKVKGLTVKHSTFVDTLTLHSDKFLYLDPPYANGGKLYGRKGDMHERFDHEELASMLNQRSGWILSYNDCAIVRQLYEGHVFKQPTWTYGMNRDKTSNEVLIINV